MKEPLQQTSFSRISRAHICLQPQPIHVQTNALLNARSENTPLLKANSHIFATEDQHLRSDEGQRLRWGTLMARHPRSRIRRRRKALRSRAVQGPRQGADGHAHPVLKIRSMRSTAKTVLDTVRGAVALAEKRHARTLVSSKRTPRRRRVVKRHGCMRRTRNDSLTHRSNKHGELASHQPRTKT